MEFHFDEEQIKRLEELKESSGESDLPTVVRNAIAVYDYLWQMRDKKLDVVILKKGTVIPEDMTFTKLPLSKEEMEGAG